MQGARSQLVAATLQLVTRFDPGSDRRSIESHARTMQLLRDTPDPFSRHFFEPGHMTASAVVLSPERTHTVLVHHQRLDRWLQPGGHVEPQDYDLLCTARREVMEETGITLLGPTDAPLVGIDVHEIPASSGEPRHSHHDLTFCFALESDESEAVANNPQVVWCRLDRLDTYRIDAPLRRSLERALLS